MSNFKFAHLLGLKKKSSEEEDDGKEKSKKAKSRKAEDERDDEEDAEDDDDSEGMEDDDDSDPDEEEDGKTSNKGKKAKSRNAEDEGDDADAEEDEDENENRDVKKGRRAERKRCAAIFGSKAAAGRPDMAAHLAFNTGLSASAAISTLSAMGAVVSEPAKKASLDERMRQAQDVRIGPDASAAPSGSAKALVEKATSLYNSTQGKK